MTAYRSWVLAVSLLLSVGVSAPANGGEGGCSGAEFLFSFGEFGTGPGQFQLPLAIDIDGSGLLYVADAGNHRVQTFDGEGNFQAVFGGQGAGDGQFLFPRDVDIPDGVPRIYVADAGNDRIQIFTLSGFHLATIGAGDLSDPLGVATRGTQRVYVADEDSSTVKAYDANGHLRLSFGSFGSTDGLFQYPSEIEVAGRRVLVGDGNRVQAFDTSGGHVFTISGLSGVGGIHVVENGDIYVADGGNDRVVVFDSAGNFQFEFGEEGELDSISGIVVDEAAARIYLADGGNNRILVFTCEP